MRIRRWSKIIVGYDDRSGDDVCVLRRFVSRARCFFFYRIIILGHGRPWEPVIFVAFNCPPVRPPYAPRETQRAAPTLSHAPRSMEIWRSLTIFIILKLRLRSRAARAYLETTRFPYNSIIFSFRSGNFLVTSQSPSRFSNAARSFILTPSKSRFALL